MQRTRSDIFPLEFLLKFASGRLGTMHEIFLGKADNLDNTVNCYPGYTQ